jgi:5'-methylthioadenosine phosphorylase
MDIVLPDQFIDRTQSRVSTFFGDGIVAHISFADPVCPELSSTICGSGQALGLTIRNGGTYLCIEGPAFSTRAESNLYRSWGVDVIGMTALPEAKLAREAEMCYSAIALVTDYDCWHASQEEVSVEQILEYLHRNAENAASLLRKAVGSIPGTRGCRCGAALENAIITDRPAIPTEIRRRLAAILDRHLGAE